MMSQKTYIPALGLSWLLPLYDPLQRWILREPLLKGRLVEETLIAPGHTVLDLGCGTGTLAVLIKQRYPQAHVVGLDIDPRVLEQAARKARGAGLQLDFTQASGGALPYPSAHFDRVVSSLMLHHLSREQKERALSEVWRVLKPDGLLCVADFGRPHTRYTRSVALVLRHFEQVADNIDGLLPSLAEQAGFGQVEERARYATIFGTITVLRGSKRSTAEAPVAATDPA
jgi:ubiquinone/menaquinone biosynthesis C-methylase UbiE